MKKLAIRLSTFVRNNRTVLLITGLAVLVVISAILRSITPEKSTLSSAPPPTFPSIVASDFSNIPIELTGQIVSYPDTLRLYSVQPIRVSGTEIASKLGLRATNQTNWANQTKTVTLSYDPYAKRYLYTDTGFEGDSDPAIYTALNSQAAVDSALRFIRQNITSASLVPQLDDAEYYTKSETHYEPVSIDEANVVQIPFTVEIDDIPSYVGKQISQPLTISVDSSGKIVWFSVSEKLFALADYEVIRSTPKESILGLIKNGEAKILQISSENPDGFDLTKSKSIKITESLLEYRLIEDSNLLYPFLVLSAEIQVENSSIATSAKLLVPAVQTAN